MPEHLLAKCCRRQLPELLIARTGYVWRWPSVALRYPWLTVTAARMGEAKTA